MAYIGNEPLSVAFLVDTFSGNGSTVAFTMSVAPANTSSILVAVTGVVQDPSTYSVSGTTLTFSAAPPSGTSNISVRYLGIPASGVTTTAYRTVTDTTATNGQTTFTIPSYTVGYVDVFRNGVRLAAADFTATTGTTIVLASAASAGDTITTVSFYVSSVLNAIPATASSISTAYLADASVTQAKLASGVAGNGPAFSAYRTTSQSVSGNTWTKVQLPLENFDTAGAFDSTTNYRFQPAIAGYYFFSGMVTAASNSFTGVQAALYKNGSQYRVARNYATAAYEDDWSVNVSDLIYLNGTTDYIELWGLVVGSTPEFWANSAADTNLSGFLARAA